MQSPDTPFPLPPQEGAISQFPDLPPWDVPIARMSNWWIAITCPGCGQMHYPLRLLAARHGWRLTLRDLVPRLKCKTCKQRPVDVELEDTPQGDSGRYGARASRLRLNGALG